MTVKGVRPQVYAQKLRMRRAFIKRLLDNTCPYCGIEHGLYIRQPVMRSGSGASPCPDCRLLLREQRKTFESDGYARLSPESAISERQFERRLGYR